MNYKIDKNPLDGTSQEFVGRYEWILCTDIEEFPRYACKYCKNLINKQKKRAASRRNRARKNLNDCKTEIG
jgi:hypothetical protein